MEQMEVIRDQQESLAKLHFELGARQEIFTPLSEDGLRASNENMDLIMSRLEKLSIAIGRLNPAAAGTAEEEASPKTAGSEGIEQQQQQDRPPAAAAKVNGHLPDDNLGLDR